MTRQAVPRANGETYDPALTDVVYEVLLQVETQEAFAVRTVYGHITGLMDLSDLAMLPLAKDLDTLTYETPAEDADANLERDKALWVVVRRLNHFASAEPPQWVLDRQAVQRTEYKEDSSVREHE